jgi:N-acetylglucosaminyldiphosphoundecaprenol N-acetyl-beta-D-mannosaminyltransferase
MSKVDALSEALVRQPAPYSLPTETVDLLGVRIHALRLDELLAYMGGVIAARRRAVISYANIHALNVAYRLPWFRAFLNDSDIVFCDGFGVKWGARLLGAHLPERFTHTDWLARLADLASRDGFSIFLLGARPGVAAEVARRWQQLYPALRIAGSHHGYFDKAPGSAENQAVVDAINAARPNLLIVGFGMPTQERWLLENWDRLDANVALTAGAVFDYLAGAVPRAPAWMTDHGLEWLGRLVIEPRRLWRRYLVGNPLFLWRVLQQRRGRLRLAE